jgi:spore maturation protein CgeB
VRIVMFYHSLLSDWDSSGAHFVRGIAFELLSRGHEVRVYEPHQSWSFKNLTAEHGFRPIKMFSEYYPGLTSVSYDVRTLDLESILHSADLVLVHEWNDHEVVRRIGNVRARHGSLRALFHDMSHRAVTDADRMRSYDLSNYDGALVLGEAVREIYARENWAHRAWVWRQAADIRVFHPVPNTEREGDLIWIGNWGDEERTAELHEFLIGPVEALDIKTRVHGVRYPDRARAALAKAGIDYAGWIPNFEVPRTFSRFPVTVHIPRKPFVNELSGIPSMRIFEALACEIPLISAPWHDTEELFTPGKDYVTARNGEEMKRRLRDMIHDQSLGHELRFHGLRTVRARHTCSHRVDELMNICSRLGLNVAAVNPPRRALVKGEV